MHVQQYRSAIEQDAIVIWQDSHRRSNNDVQMKRTHGLRQKLIAINNNAKI